MRILLIVLAVTSAAGCTKGPPRPDILLVTIDTLRSDHCSAYGYPIATTPNLDALASAGVLYRRAYAESATTAPSHAVLMTGQHFRTYGLTRNGAELSADAVTLAEKLKEAGYQTAAFVSSFPVMQQFGFSQGFDTYDDAFTAEETSIGRRSSKRMPHDRVASATVARIERFLADRNDSRPLFMWVHFVDPHKPYRAPETFEGGWPEGAGKLLKAIRAYDNEVHYADAQLGVVLARLGAEATERGQLVVVTSDHGEGLGDHDWMTHGIHLYEEAVRVPLVAKYTGVLPANKVVEEPVGIIDIAPGILALLQIDSPTFSHGRKLFEPGDPARTIHLQRREYQARKERGRTIKGDMHGIVSGSSKLITAPEEQMRELYDLAADPREKTNLALPAGAAAPAGSEAPGEATARLLEDSLAHWQNAYPAAEKSAEPLDRETLRALRSLGYVD